MMQRDYETLSGCRKRLIFYHFGAVPLAGTTYQLIRPYDGRVIGFEASNL